MTCGVYAIVHKRSKKLYVGSSVGIEGRLKNHLRGLNKGKHCSRYLLRAWEKYGRNAFVTKILEVCSSKNLLEREQHYMDLYRSYDSRFGFNCSPNATNPGLTYEQRCVAMQACRDVLSAKAKKQWADPLIRSRMIRSYRRAGKRRRGKPGPRLGAIVSAKTRMKLSLSAKKRVTRKWRKERSRIMKRKWANSRFRSRMLKIREVQFTLHTRELLSKAQKANWANPRYYDLQTKLICKYARSKKGRRQLSKNAKNMTRAQYKTIGARMRELWKDPVWREAVISKQRAGRVRERIGVTK